MIENYISTEKPPKVRPWTLKKENELKRLKDDMVPLQETALGEATIRFAMAVLNNLELLPDEMKAKFLSALDASSEEVGPKVI